VLLAADKPTMRQSERMLRLARRGQRAAKMMSVSERSVTSASFVTKHAPNLVSKLDQGQIAVSTAEATIREAARLAAQGDRIDRGYIIENAAQRAQRNDNQQYRYSTASNYTGTIRTARAD
jgi:hypothetical protein